MFIIVRRQAVSALAKESGILHVCDATFATPVMMKPLELGADMTLHASTCKWRFDSGGSWNRWGGRGRLGGWSGAKEVGVVRQAGL